MFLRRYYMTLVIYFRVFLAVIMISSGILKLFSLKSFKVTVSKLIQSRKLISFGTYLIILLELLCGILLFLDNLSSYGVYISFLLISSYLWAVWRATALKSKITCNCFGDWVPEELGKSTLYRIFALTILSIVLLFSNASLNLVDPYEVLLSVLLSVSFICLYAVSNSFLKFNKISK